ncbi:MAG: DUF1049 domain-containing protein [Burkholderiales bacterium]|nr:MAG: DUF1049 domain-containing protein [Burkholderiales bacterium]
MRVIAWILRIAVFLVVLAFALANTQPVSVRLFGPEATWEAPLVVVLLAGFALGALAAYLALVPGLVRRRRELSRLRRALESERASSQAPNRARSADLPAPIPEQPLT